MKTRIEYEVSFELEGEEQAIVPGRKNITWFKLQTVVVHLEGPEMTHRDHVFYASGSRVKKGGGVDKRFGSGWWGSVDLPPEEIDKWVERARSAVRLYTP